MFNNYACQQQKYHTRLNMRCKITSICFLPIFLVNFLETFVSIIFVQISSVNSSSLWMFVVVFLMQEHFKKSKQIFDMFKWTSYQGHKCFNLVQPEGIDWSKDWANNQKDIFSEVGLFSRFLTATPYHRESWPIFDP